MVICLDSSGLTRNRQRRLGASEWQAERRRIDTGQRSDALQQILSKSVALLEGCVLCRRQRNAHDQDSIGLDAAVDVLQGHERSDGQACADQQHDRQRHFDHHEEVAGPAALRSRASTSARLQRVGDVRLRRLQCRHHAKENPGEQRHSERKEQHGKVDRDPRFVRHVELRHQTDDRTSREEREQHAEDTAGQRQEHALGEQLTHQPAAPRANRHAHRHLARPRSPACQLQVGDVGASDQQQESDGTQQQPKARLHLAAGDRHIEIVPKGGREALRRERRRLFEREAFVQSPELFLADRAATPGASRTIG